MKFSFNTYFNIFLFCNLLLLIVRTFIPFDAIFGILNVINLSLSFIFVKFNKISIYLFILLLFSWISFFYSILNHSTLILASIGFLSIFMFLIVYINVKDRVIVTSWLLNFFIWVFIFSSIFQFFLSKNLWGLIPSNFYSGEFENITKRAISLFTHSPQSTGFISGVLFVRECLRNNTNYVKLILLIFVGLLTFSKIFLIFVLIGIIQFDIKKFYLGLSFSIIGLMFFSIYNLSIFQDGISRFSQITNIISDVSSYNTFHVWEKHININFKSFFQFLLGIGLGLLSRNNDNIFFHLGYTSSESFVFQVFNEIGFIGFLIYFISLFKSISEKKRILIYSIFLASIFNPVFYGITTSFLVYICLFNSDYDKV